MAWDEAAENMAVNVIAKVEGSGAWDAINYNDPITLGLMQWFGTRAANLLNLIKDQNASAYAGIAASVRNDVAAHSKDSRWWTTRYLTRAEGATIKPALRASKDIQGNLVKSDVIDYKAAAQRIGLNPDTNTNTVIFWMCMYHQTPARAINLMKRIGMGSSLERTYRACLNETVFGRYKSRYTQAYNYIKSGNPPEIIDLNDDDAEGGDDATGGVTPPDSNGQDSIFDQVQEGIKRVEVVGDQIVIHTTDKGMLTGVPNGSGQFLLKVSKRGEVVPDATPEPEESDQTEGPANPDLPANEGQQKIVKFMYDRRGKYAYSQGPGRLKPDQAGYTDCSALTRFAYLSVTGKDIGTYTDAQVTNKNTYIVAQGSYGSALDVSKLRPGDLVITASKYTAANRLASHVEIFVDANTTIGHGGPGRGPITKPFLPLLTVKKRWWIKRLKGW